MRECVAPDRCAGYLVVAAMAKDVPAAIASQTGAASTVLAAEVAVLMVVLGVGAFNTHQMLAEFPSDPKAKAKAKAAGQMGAPLSGAGPKQQAAPVEVKMEATDGDDERLETVEVAR